MILLKLLYHINAAIKKSFYMILFRKKLKFGKKSTFRKGFNISIEGEGRIIIGNKVFFNNYCSLNSLSQITIGDNTIFGENIRIYDHNHRFSNLQRGIMEQGYNKAPVIIGNNCWICSNVVILKGVTIGDNVIIGAGSVISKDIPDNVVVKGSGEITIEGRR